MRYCKNHKLLTRGNFKCPRCLLEERGMELVRCNREIKELKEKNAEIDNNLTAARYHAKTSMEELEALKPYCNIPDDEISFRKSEIESVVKSLVTMILERKNSPYRVRSLAPGAMLGGLLGQQTQQGHLSRLIGHCGNLFGF